MFLFGGYSGHVVNHVESVFIWRGVFSGDWFPWGLFVKRQGVLVGVKRVVESYVVWDYLKVAVFLLFLVHYMVVGVDVECLITKPGLGGVGIILV